MIDYGKYPIFEQELIRTIAEAAVTHSVTTGLSPDQRDTVACDFGELIAHHVRSAAGAFLADSAGPSNEHASMLLNWLANGMRAKRERAVEEARP